MLEELLVNDTGNMSYPVMNDNLIYLDYINAKYQFEYITTTPDVAYRNQGNLFGLFKDMGVSPQLYLYTMYINGIQNPTWYDGKKLVFKLAIKPPIPAS